MCVCVLIRFSRVQLFMTVWRVTPLSVSLSRLESWSGLPFPPPGDLPDPGIEFESLMSPVLVGGFFTVSPTWEVQCWAYLQAELRNSNSLGTIKTHCNQLVSWAKKEPVFP